MKLVFVFLIILLLLLKPVKASLYWSQNQESVPSGSQYSPGKGYEFQINWTADENHTVNEVILESNFSTLNETIDNHSFTFIENSTILSTSSFGDLPAGAYVYRWYAADNESNWNSTDQLRYVVNQNNSAVIKLYLNGTQANKEYDLNKVANFTASLSISNKTIYLDSNYTGFVLQNSPNSRITSLINLTSSGLFGMTAYWNGDENYSAFSQTYYFDNMPPKYLTRSEYPTNPTYYNPNMAYTFGSTWNDLNISQVLFESNFSGTFRNYSIGTTPGVQNNSNNFFIVILSLPAETFSYRWIAFDTLNHVSNSTQYGYQILKAFPLLIGVTPSRNVSIGTETTVICTSTTSQVPISGFNLYRNNLAIVNDTLQTRKDEQFLSKGAYEYVCNSTETQNFSAQTVKLDLTVGIIAPVEIVSLNLTGPSSIQANVGETAEADFFLENNLGYSLNDLLVDLTGISSNWYKIGDIATNMPNNFSLIIRLHFNIPPDAEQGDYSFTLRALGKTPSNETKVATKLVVLSIAPPQQSQVFPPVYSTSLTTKSDGGYEFSLKWNDDTGLSGYIFSSNISGTWENDSFVPLTGTDAWVNVTKNISLSAGQTIAWKVYATDTNNLSTESQEFDLTAESVKSDMVFPIITLSLFVVGLATLLLFLTHRKSKKASKKENAVYVYRKDDLK